jgi:hypothetical protein
MMSIILTLSKVIRYFLGMIYCFLVLYVAKITLNPIKRYVTDRQGIETGLFQTTLASHAKPHILKCQT